jgi:hypothetical protein
MRLGRVSRVIGPHIAFPTILDDRSNEQPISPTGLRDQITVFCRGYFRERTYSEVRQLECELFSRRRIGCWRRQSRFSSCSLFVQRFQLKRALSLRVDAPYNDFLLGHICGRTAGGFSNYREAARYRRPEECLHVASHFNEREQMG